MKKKEEQLVRKVTDMIQKTREGKLHWDIQCQTTEYNDPAKKPVETEEGETWVIDECFVSYHCMDQEKEFLLVSYEQIYTCGEKKKSCNLIFLPPLGIRFFDVDVLAPFARMKLKGIDGDPHKRWSMWFNSKQREEPYQVLTSR